MGTAVRVKRIALIALMSALTLGAGLAIFVLVSGFVEEPAIRLLGTAGFVALFSLTGLCSALPIERGILPAVGVAGVIASGAGFLVGLAYAWGLIMPTDVEDLRPLAVAVVVAVALGWASLVLLRLRRSAAVTSVAVATAAAIAVVAGLLVWSAFADPGEDVRRATAVVAILAVLGSFLTPMLDRILRPSRPPAPGFGPSHAESGSPADD